MNRPILSIVLITLLVACTAERAPVAADSQPAPAEQPDIDDQPAKDVPPATARSGGADQPAGETNDPYPAGAPPDGDRALASFDGYGQIRFGTAAEAMSEDWGGELVSLYKEGNPSCYFMTPTWVKAPTEFNFMIGDGKFVRFETDNATFIAPGGGKVGATRAQIHKLYAGRIEERPNEYSSGNYLRIKDEAGGKGVLVFETDGKADDATVTRWRVGVPPHVDHLQGCV